MWILKEVYSISLIISLCLFLRLSFFDRIGPPFLVLEGMVKGLRIFFFDFFKEFLIVLMIQQ